jgi:CheY-like chemotaxis protein
MHDTKAVEILLVEDNPTDAELCIRALKKRNLGNHLEWVKDGAEALDFLYARGNYASRKPDDIPAFNEKLLELLERAPVGAGR